MTHMEFCDKHNMVAFLQKSTGSDGFHEIVDFIAGSHIMYALTTNPTIYVSHIKQFWQTATVRTIDNGEQQLTATVDGKAFIITKASVRRHLQLADADNINVLPNTKIFDQLTLMGMLALQTEEGECSGNPYEPQPPLSTSQPINEEPIPNVASSSHQKTQTPRQALTKVTELPQTSGPITNVADEAVYEEWDDRVERATTTAASLDAEHASGTIPKTQSTAMPNVPLPQGIGAGGSPRCQEAMGGSIYQTRSERVPTQPSDSPLPRVNTLGSDEGRLKEQNELIDLCTKLSEKVTSLEEDLKQTKIVYGKALTKLVKKVKKLEQQGRKIAKIDQDEGITLVQTNAESQGRFGNISTAGAGINTASPTISTASLTISAAETLVYIRRSATKDKGKGIMQQTEQTKKMKKKVQIQMSIDEELAQKIHEDEVARFEAEQEAKFTEEQETTEDEPTHSVFDIDWDDVQAQIQADEDLAQRMLEEEREF
ncbi:hypothetical protein Tco_0785052 [Tanacetum coccineum]